MNDKNLYSFSLAIFILFLFVSSCSKDKLLSPILSSNQNPKYLYISHTRNSSNNYIASSATNINYNYFDLILLGGDLCIASSIDNTTLNYIDNIFNISNPNTLWSLGNHDYSDIDLVSSYTNRLSYYSYTKNNICYLVLDTQDSMSNIIGSQLELVTQVTDTLEHCSHLVVLHHKFIQLYNNPQIEYLQHSVPNARIGSSFYEINPNNFYTDVYPKLLQVKAKGVGVICIAGDLGRYKTDFEYKTPEGIYFLANGIQSGQSQSKVLIFEHDIERKKLSWQFKPLCELEKL